MSSVLEITCLNVNLTLVQVKNEVIELINFWTYTTYMFFRNIYANALDPPEVLNLGDVFRKLHLSYVTLFKNERDRIIRPWHLGQHSL